MSIIANLKRIQKEIGQNVKIVVVTKGRSIQEMDAAQKAGAEIIGENRVQEAERKWGANSKIFGDSKTERHLIGHLQTNKIKQALRLFNVIQSVDTIKLAEKINEEGQNQRKKIKIMMQVNIGKEPQKYGFQPEDIEKSIIELAKMKYIKIEGLMAIIPYRENPEETRPYFHAMKELHQKLLQSGELSMGMSHDYRVAIEEGATMIRIGSAIFSACA